MHTHSIVSTQPYDDPFDIMRFRECELLHSRWAMLGLVGAAAAEAATGVSWADAGKVELEQPQYLGFPLPGLSVSALTTIEVLLMGYLEVARSAELDQGQDRAGFSACEASATLAQGGLESARRKESSMGKTGLFSDELGPEATGFSESAI